mmetsp:Transcript_35594/g.69728  ORF Transcript_35594/g.69728 Transcript_35594/m.69728 type:complete len:200 (-) Transcript_35594:168-767(-)
MPLSITIATGVIVCRMLARIVLAAMIGSALAFPSPAPARAPVLTAPKIRLESLYEPMPLAPEDACAAERVRLVALRGGFVPVPEDTARRFLTVSSACLFAMGFAMFLKPDFAWKYMMLVDPAPACSDTAREILATALVAWGCAKLTLLRQGEQAAKDYCRLNLFPMALLIASYVKNGVGAFSVAGVGLFAAGCAYVGFT